MSNAFADEVITVSSTAIGPTAAELTSGASPVTKGIFSVEGANIRAFWGGGTPTTSVGIPIPAGTVFELSGTKNVNSLLMIRDDAVDATVNAQYEQGA